MKTKNKPSAHITGTNRECKQGAYCIVYTVTFKTDVQSDSYSYLADTPYYFTTLAHLNHPADLHDDAYNDFCGRVDSIHRRNIYQDPEVISVTELKDIQSAVVDNIDGDGGWRIFYYKTIDELMRTIFCYARGRNNPVADVYPIELSNGLDGVCSMSDSTIIFEKKIVNKRKEATA
ncbi:MAG: hypothetical protein LUE98_04535 [Tannerellaceae bacterium]|nr:hypothetical protein [Tannerellaceae bacterium]